MNILTCQNRPLHVLVVVAIILLLVKNTSQQSIKWLTADVPASGTGKFFGLGVRANIYGYPLLGTIYYSKTFSSVNCTSTKEGYAPLNVFNYVNVATSNNTVIKSPNVDVIYASIILDLTKGPVILEHPNMGNRYFSFQITDPYGNVVGYVGSRTTGTTAGRFAFKWVNDLTSGHTHMTEIKQIITVNYSTTVLVGRFFVINDSDVVAVKNILPNFKIIPPGGLITVPACDPNANFTIYNIPAGLPYYKALNEALELYPPPPRDEEILRALSTIGIGMYSKGFVESQFTPAEKNALVRANSYFLPALQISLQWNRFNNRHDNNGWSIPPPNVGNFGTDYLRRASVTLVGLLANTEEEAHYRGASYDADGNRLNSNMTYRLTFPPGAEPPVNEFWSLTLYNSNFLLPPDLMEPIHSVASKKSTFVRQLDGTVVIQLSRTRPNDPSINWLPTPLSFNNFLINLRCYNPQQPILDRTWICPGIERVK